MRKKTTKNLFILQISIRQILTGSAVALWIFVGCKSTPKKCVLDLSQTPGIEQIAIDYLNDHHGLFQTKMGDSLNETHLEAVMRYAYPCISAYEVHPDSNWSIDRSVSVLQSSTGLCEAFSFDAESGRNLYVEFQRFKNLVNQLPDTCAALTPLYRYFAQKVKNLEKIDSINFNSMDFPAFRLRLFDFERRSYSLTPEDIQVLKEESRSLWTTLDSIIRSSQHESDLVVFAGSGIEYIFFLVPKHRSARHLFVWYRPSLSLPKNDTIDFVIKIL